MAAFLPTLSGIVTGILIVLFAGIVVWAWSRRRRADFDATSKLPLEEDPGTKPGTAADRKERAP